jgi:hypothetical protein
MTTRVSSFEHHSTVMYGYHMDQNPEEGIYSLNFEAGHLWRKHIKSIVGYRVIISFESEVKRYS